MNTTRRKVITGIKSRLEQIEGEIERLCYEEQETYDNMPESFQSGEKGQKVETAIEALEGASDLISEALDHLDTAAD